MMKHELMELTEIAIIVSLLQDSGMVLTGAVYDFTEPSTGKNKLFFPVKKNEK